MKKKHTNPKVSHGTTNNFVYLGLHVKSRDVIVNKDSSLKAKARTKESGFVFKDNQVS